MKQQDICKYKNKKSVVGEGGDKNYAQAFKLQFQHGAELPEQPQSYRICVQVPFFTGSVQWFNTLESITCGLGFLNGDHK